MPPLDNLFDLIKINAGSVLEPAFFAGFPAIFPKSINIEERREDYRTVYGLNCVHVLKNQFSESQP